MTAVTFHPLADREITEALEFYDDRAAGLGAALLAEVKEAVSLLRRHPESAPCAGGDVRRLVLRHFPYNLLYTHQRSQIRILALAHHRREPTYWVDRQ